MSVTRARLLAAAAALGFFAAACRKPAEPVPAKPAASAGLEKPYPLKGVVVSVDRAGGKVTLKHEAVPGYMDAMTMPFAVAETKILDDLKPGDTVEAKLLVGDRSSHLEGIVGLAASGQRRPR